MFQRFKEPHYRAFTEIAFQAQGPLGKAPSQWAADLGLSDIPNSEQLPQHSQNRKDIRLFCRDPNMPVLSGYVCAMAWGWQEKGPRGGRGVTGPWEHRNKIQSHLEKLRHGGYSRSAAYNLFRREGKIPGLGPSYFTKLLYFFSPEENFYIMNQWTAKSINLLTGEQVVQLAGSSPSDKNKGGNYQAYCEEVDALANELKVTGDEIEQRLMSKGKPNQWPWREHVVAHSGYNRARIQKRYPHISVREL